MDRQAFFNDLKRRFTADQKAIAHLEVILECRFESGDTEIDIKDLYETIRPHSCMSFACIMDEIIDHGLVVEFVRITIPDSMMPVLDFDSVVDIPETIREPDTGYCRRILPHYLKSVIRITDQGARHGTANTG